MDTGIALRLSLFSSSLLMKSPPSDNCDRQLRNGPVQQPLANPNAALYPWSQRRLNYTTSHPSPFPRYGAAVNSVSSKEGDIYIMGGLINSSTVKGDLWMIEAGQSMSTYPLATTAEGPGPRVGHASLLVGNAFIVYGGDTKVEETDVLDETLYLLNTCMSLATTCLLDLPLLRVLTMPQPRDNGRDPCPLDRDRLVATAIP